MPSFQQLRHRIATARGTAARLTHYLPAPVQLKLAQAMGYRHDYPELEPHIRLLLAVRQLQGGEGAGLLTKDAEKSRRHFRNEMRSIAG